MCFCASVCAVGLVLSHSSCVYLTLTIKTHAVNPCKLAICKAFCLDVGGATLDEPLMIHIIV